MLPLYIYFNLYNEAKRGVKLRHSTSSSSGGQYALIRMEYFNTSFAGSLCLTW